MRTFHDKPAIRQAVPLFIGLVGASGSGKTYSALRLASGLSPNEPIFYIDTEARRSLWYADKFKFQHIDFQAPFGPLDYLAAIQHCASKGAKTIIVDSLSHEHEGVGGVLEMHETEADRLSKAWNCSRDKANMSAWAKPKTQRRQLLNAILQMPVNFIFCFRAKEKIDLKGPKPKTMGWMPIAGEEHIYEMSVNCLLMPNAGGVPSWHPEEMGEKAIIKLPEQFKSIFAKQQPLSEEIGRSLADWARGGKVNEPKTLDASVSDKQTEMGGSQKESETYILVEKGIRKVNGLDAGWNFFHKESLPIEGGKLIDKSKLTRFWTEDEAVKKFCVEHMGVPLKIEAELDGRIIDVRTA